MTYRIGIVGAGFLPRHSLIPALRGMPGGRLVAVLDSSPRALAEVARHCPAARMTTSEADFFDVPMDAVHVATPNHLHEHFACRAAERGLAVLVDKPLAHTVDSARRIVTAAAGAGVPAIVGYMSKHNVFNREARRLVAAGAIGEPLAMVAARLGWRKDGDWRSRPAESGLGCLADLGIYPLLTAVDLFGADPVRCHATAWPVRDPNRTDLYAQATLWFDDRRYLQFQAAATFLEQPASAEVASYTVVGDAGIVQVDGAWRMDGSGALEWCGAGGWRRATLTPVDPYRAQYELLARCSAGEPVPAEVSLERGLRDVEILYAIEESAAASAARATGGAPLVGTR